MTPGATSQLRWLCKKSARQAVAKGSIVVGKLSGNNATPRIRVLTYHRFGEVPRDPFCVRAKDFEAHIKYLAEQNLAISLSQLTKTVNGDAAPKKTQVLVTIDDGLMSTYSIALPILRRFNVPAIAFVSPGLIDKQIHSRHCGEALEPYVDWEQVSTLSRQGVTIGSHALSHRSLGNMSAVELEVEVRRSKEMIESHVEGPVLSFAYPFGTYADFNPRTTAAVKNAGYLCAFTSQHGSIQPGANLLELPRVKIEGGEDLAMFRRIVEGGLDAWRFVDRALWPLQARGA